MGTGRTLLTETVPKGVLTSAACLVAAMALPLPAQERRDDAPLLEGPVASDAARYDQASGRCSDGAEQLLDAAELRRLSAAWSATRTGMACTTPGQRSASGRAEYPRWFSELGIAGSAQVMVMLEADGAVADVRPVCASDRAFADAAVRTARALAYTPATCDGTPVRSSFLLPFQYDAPPPPPPLLRTAGLHH